MNARVKQLLSSALIVCAVCLLFTVNASASVIGTVHIDSGLGGATVGLASIDWFPPVGAPNGTFTVGGSTFLTSAVGNVTPGLTGSLLDLNTAPPIMNFMTFPTVPGLAFDLLSIGAGSSNTNCATAVNVGDSCSIFVGSPVVLTRTSSGTAVSLGIAGVARDGTTPTNFLGTFTTQFSGRTPLSLQQAFGCQPGLGAGACTIPSHTETNTFSADFVVPEPTSLSLLGFGLLSLALYRKRQV
jgi:hypothetical protein